MRTILWQYPLDNIVILTMKQNKEIIKDQQMLTLLTLTMKQMTPIWTEMLETIVQIVKSS